jgi:hypothetical protein
MTSGHLKKGAEPTTAALYVSNVLTPQAVYYVQHSSGIINQLSRIFTQLCNIMSVRNFELEVTCSNLFSIFFYWILVFSKRTIA